MSVYKITEIAKDVRIALDRNKSSDNLLLIGDIDTLSLDEIIYSKIEDGVKAIESISPLSYLESGYNFGETIYWNDNGTGWIILPENFLRLISFKMSDWQRTLYSAITEQDPEYALQASEFAGIRGNAERPVIAIVNRSVGTVLEFYSSKDNTAKVEQAVYLPMPQIIDEMIEICDKCYRASIYMIAGLTLQACNDNQATEMIELSKNMIS